LNIREFRLFCEKRVKIIENHVRRTLLYSENAGMERSKIQPSDLWGKRPLFFADITVYGMKMPFKDDFHKHKKITIFVTEKYSKGYIWAHF